MAGAPQGRTPRETLEAQGEKETLAPLFTVGGGELIVAATLLHCLADLTLKVLGFSTEVVDSLQNRSEFVVGEHRHGSGL
jgi:hypothetical protein